MHSAPRARRMPRRILAKTLWTIAGIIGAILIFFFCQDVFAGYPQYGTDIITYVGLTIVMAVAAYAWIIDHRRLDAGEFDAGRPDARGLDAGGIGAGGIDAGGIGAGGIGAGGIDAGD